MKQLCPGGHVVDRHPLKRLVLLISLFLVTGIMSALIIPWDRQLLVMVQPFGDGSAGRLLPILAKYCGNGFYQASAVVLAALLAWRHKWDTMSTCMFLALAAIMVSGIAANVMKLIVGRARPGENLSNWYTSPFSAGNDFHSFPSGHTATSFALAYVLSSVYPRFTPFWYTGAFMVGVGRVVGESHFPSDVMGGALLGIASGWFVVRLRMKLTEAA